MSIITMNDVKNNFPKFEKMFAKNKKEFLKLIPTCKQFDKNDINKIYEALLLAEEMHKGETRKSGEAYINHPIAVASIEAKIGLDGPTTISSLLHDVPENTHYPISEIESQFGTDVATIVDGVTKIGKDVNEPTHKKILNGGKKDIRVFAVKTGDRAHNMYTLSALPPSKQIEIATETNDFYIPILKILGIYEVKDELQDLCLFYLNNDEFFKYKKIKERLEKKYNGKLNTLGEITQDELSKMGYAMRYKYRVKNVGGMYEDIKNGTNLRKIKDLLAIKMIVDDDLICYQTLGVVHGLGEPDFENLRDYIANPKSDGYKSLNTNINFKDSDIQVRIRTRGMQSVNDLGVFADWNMDNHKKVNEVMIKELSKLSKKGVK